MTSAFLLTPTDISQALPDALMHVKNTRTVEHQGLGYFPSPLTLKPATSMFAGRKPLLVTSAEPPVQWYPLYCTYTTSPTMDGTKRGNTHRLDVYALTCAYSLPLTPDKGVTPPRWSVSKVLAFWGAPGGRHTESGTVSNLPRLLERLERRFWEQSGKRGA